MTLASNSQLALLRCELNNTGYFPSTRYQGSKIKIIDWISSHTKKLKFDNALDAFAGTGSVAYMLKRQGKQVFYNDYLKFNYYIGLALIENNGYFLEKEDLDFILTRHKEINYPTFIYDTFHDIYFTDDENLWLDQTITNIYLIKNKYKRALALFPLFQSCIIKRPYNLFHRKNLYVRTAHVKRSFGNKKTWDTPFEEHFIKFTEEANNAVFDNGKNNKAYHGDILELSTNNVDLVYIDTPYISSKGVGINYFDFYHFLEGITQYDKWKNFIDYESKHRKIKNDKNGWYNKENVHLSFKKLFNKFKNSILVISYRNDGIPTIDEIVQMLKAIGKEIEIKTLEYKYVLSNEKSKEVLIIAE